MKKTTEIPAIANLLIPEDWDEFMKVVDAIWNLTDPKNNEIFASSIRKINT